MYQSRQFYIETFWLFWSSSECKWKKFRLAARNCLSRSLPRLTPFLSPIKKTKKRKYCLTGTHHWMWRKMSTSPSRGVIEKLEIALSCLRSSLRTTSNRCFAPPPPPHSLFLSLPPPIVQHSPLQAEQFRHDSLSHRLSDVHGTEALETREKLEASSSVIDGLKSELAALQGKTRPTI